MTTPDPTVHDSASAETGDLEALRQQLVADRAAFRREKAISLAREQVIEYARRCGVRRPELAWTALSKALDALDLDLEGEQGARNFVAPVRDFVAEFPELLTPLRTTQ